MDFCRNNKKYTEMWYILSKLYFKISKNGILMKRVPPEAFRKIFRKYLEQHAVLQWLLHVVFKVSRKEPVLGKRTLWNETQLMLYQWNYIVWNLTINNSRPVGKRKQKWWYSFRIHANQWSGSKVREKYNNTDFVIS